MGIRKYNFNPGPATLPLSVLEKAQKEFVDYNNLGMSVLEMSHRSKEFEDILNKAKSLLTEIMGIPNNYDILFLGGGASLQFTMVPMNMLVQGKPADYIITGTWAQKAYKDAKLYGDVKIAATTEEKTKDGGSFFRRIPKLEEIKFSPDASYVHLTSNNTIFGSQWHTFPDTGKVPLVADMSSDILSRKVDVSKFALIYAGAQKNLGPAGVTVVILRKDLLERCPKNIGTLLSYKPHAEENSLYNTPPVYAIYIVKLVLEWVKEIGGLSKVQEMNKKKADIIYGTMDKFPEFFKGTVEKDSRSWMNVTLRLPSEDIEKDFLGKADKQNFYGLKGHRSVGGIRVSMYNAMPVEGIEKLAAFMEDYAKKSKK